MNMFPSRETKEKEKAAEALRAKEEETLEAPSNEDQETKAAVVLQSNFRGYKERKKYNERKRTTAGEESPAIVQTAHAQRREDEDGGSTREAESDEEEESTYEAEENYDSDHTQVPADDEQTEIGEDDADVGQDAECVNPVEDEEEELSRDEETKAATVLQSNFRGHKERKRLQEEGKIPAKKGHTGGEHAPEREDAEDVDEAKAAVVLQSNFRGHKERKRLEEEGKIPKRRKNDVIHQDEDPSDLQQDASGKSDGLDEEKAATVLQSNFRGHRDRKKLKAEREALTAAEEAAVTYNDAEEEEEEEVLDVSDVVIEHNDEAAAEKERQEEEQAAVKIQSNFRGYKDRKNLRANKETALKEAEQLEDFSKEVNSLCFSQSRRSFTSSNPPIPHPSITRWQRRLRNTVTCSTS